MKMITTILYKIFVLGLLLIELPISLAIALANSIISPFVISIEALFGANKYKEIAKDRMIVVYEMCLLTVVMTFVELIEGTR